MTDISYYTCNEKYILLIEDVDRTEFISRESYTPPPLSMDCFLNAIDGVAEPHGRVLLMSANDPDRILDNSALVRPGRIDKCIEFSNCNGYQIKKLYELFYDGNQHVVDWDNWEFNSDLSAAYVIKLLQENINKPDVFIRLVCEPIKEDDSNMDPSTREEIEAKKNKASTENKKHIENRAYINRRGRRPPSNKITDKIRRVKYTLKRGKARIKAINEQIEKAEAKLPLFLEKFKEKQEKEKIIKLKAKAKKRAKYIKSLNQANSNEVDDFVEEEYETPAFLSNSIEADEVPDETITTYEVMEDN
jgi:hypothetical protein